MVHFPERGTFTNSIALYSIMKECRAVSGEGQKWRDPAPHEKMHLGHVDHARYTAFSAESSFFLDAVVCDPPKYYLKTWRE